MRTGIAESLAQLPHFGFWLVHKRAVAAVQCTQCSLMELLTAVASKETLESPYTYTLPRVKGSICLKTRTICRLALGTRIKLVFL